MAPALDKDREILNLIDRLRADLGVDAFVIVDHWEADRCAIGLAMPANHQTLVYVSTYKHPTGEYNYELESPPVADDEMYAVAGRGDGCTYEELLEVIKSHLRLET